MTKITENLEIKNAVNDFTKKKDISKSELAKLIGISSATLSHLEGERWDLLSEEMALKIWNFVKPIEWNIVRTANFDSIFKICKDAKKNGKMIGVIGYTGAGKTTALNEYYSNTKHVYLITCKKSMKPRHFFEELLRQLGVSFTGTIYDMIKKASELLNGKNSPLLIIDEAGKLSPTLLLYLHDLRDNTLHHAGIVMAGVDYFKANLMKAVTKQKEGMPEFYSRVIMWYDLRMPNKLEIEAICKANGLQSETAITELVRGEFKVKDYRELYNSITNYNQLETAHEA